MLRSSPSFHCDVCARRAYALHAVRACGCKVCCPVGHLARQSARALLCVVENDDGVHFEVGLKHRLVSACSENRADM